MTASASEFRLKPRLRTAETTKGLGLTRSKAISLLEFFDEIGFTLKREDFLQRVASELPSVVFASGARSL